ncbi:MAG: hypothetical protein FWC00_01395 [Firmicutes bacterium]|nr:hypothetical protein [Bacillota bacterium]
MSKPRVLVNYVEAGMGHITSAMSVADSLREHYGDELEIIDAHMFRDTENKHLAEFGRYLSEGTKSFSKSKYLSDFNFAMRDMLGPQKLLKVTHELFPKAKKAAIKFFRSIEPDVIATTHFSDAYFAKSYQKRKKSKPCKVVTYNPDFDMFGMWNNKTDLFIVNNPIAYGQALAQKFKKKNLRQVPFLIRKDIANFGLTKEQCREKHGLPQDKFTVVLTDSIYGAARLRPFTDELLKTKSDMTIIPAVGKNQELMSLYSGLSQNQPGNITLNPVGLRLDLFEFYKAADVAVVKAGPNTLLDCGFMGTPVITNFFATPTEEFSKNLFIQEYGMGEEITDAEECRKRLEAFASDPALLEGYRENAERHFNINETGGKAIADIIYESSIS